MLSVVFNGGFMGEKLFDLSKIKLYAIIWGFKIFLRNSFLEILRVVEI